MGARTVYCSFCGKSQHKVRRLIAGPDVFICDECVELFNDILAAEPSSPAKPRYRVRADGWMRKLAPRKRWPLAERG